MNHILDAAAASSTGGYILGMMTIIFILAFIAFGVGLPYLQREELEEMAKMPLEDD